MFVPFKGKIYESENFEVLTKFDTFAWFSCPPKEIPKNAVLGSERTDNKKLFIGRAMYNSEWHVGTVGSSKFCLILVDGKEIKMEKFEVLVETKDESEK